MLKQIRTFIFLVIVFITPIKSYSQVSTDSLKIISNSAEFNSENYKTKDWLIQTIKSKLKNSIPNSERIDLLNLICEAYIKIGNAESADSMILYNNEALVLAKKDSSKKEIAYSLFVGGKIEISFTKRYSLATEKILEAKSLYENLNDSNGIAMCYNQLGLINYLLTIYKTAIENFENSLTYNDAVDLQNAIAKYLIALSYAELEDTMNGKKYFDFAIQTYTQIGKQNKIRECYSYMAKMYVAANDLAKAEKYFDLLENGTDKIIDEQTIGRVQAIKSGYYFKKNQLAIAIDFASKGFATGLKFGDEITCRLASDVLYKVYEIKGDFKNAFYYINYLKQLNDAFYNTNIAQRIAEITTNAKFDKKMLIEKQAEEKKSELARKENI